MLTSFDVFGATPFFDIVQESSQQVIDFKVTKLTKSPNVSG
jgi:hypothetical protein